MGWVGQRDGGWIQGRETAEKAQKESDGGRGAQPCRQTMLKTSVFS